MQKLASSMIVGHRLHSTLFAVALFHGLLVLGVTFAPEKDRGEGVPTLEVVMLIDPDENQENPDRAEYVAQTSQLGSGTTEQTVHPTSGQLQPFASEGNAGGNDLQDTEAERPPSQESILAARARQDPTVQVDPAENLESAEQQRVAMQMTRSDSQALAELERAPNPQITGQTKREMFVAVNTSQSDVAEYLARWKQKIERMGTLNFPTAARTTILSGNPTLEVALRADGSLEEIIILRSSGHKELDLAAMRILRLAAPFDPFPQQFRAHYDVLRFVYEWQFLDGKIEAGSLQVTDRQPPP
ncbi:MAG: TonB family protein [Gammaproteobacteria bacterium]|nr:TonB family protein [Gammaproteobacteria bacterium]